MTSKANGKDLHLLVIPHPFASLTASKIVELAERIGLEFEEAFRVNKYGDSLEESEYKELIPLNVSAEEEASFALFRDKLTDGLPVIVPTPERVEAMMKYWPGDKRLVGPIPPLNGMMTIESMAANAVMAGCKPEYFPVVVNAINASLDPALNLYSVQTTTHVTTTMMIMSGPLAKELGIESGAGCMGPCFIANATIGRAIRLILQNGGGAWPVEVDKATFGSPTKFGFCFAENEAVSPYPPYRTDFGVDKEFTTVTMYASEAPHNINDHGSKTAEDLLKTITLTMATAGNNNLYWNGDTFVVLGPEHAEILASAGYTKEDVSKELHRLARVTIKNMSRENYEYMKSAALGKVRLMNKPQPKEEEYADSEGKVPIVQSPDLIKIIVAGGPGRHSVWIPSFGLSYSVTHVIRNSKGEPVRTFSDFLAM